MIIWDCLGLAGKRLFILSSLSSCFRSWLWEFAWQGKMEQMILVLSIYRERSGFLVDGLFCRADLRFASRGTRAGSSRGGTGRYTQSKLDECIALLSSIHNRIEAAAATRQSYRNDNYALSELDSAVISSA